MTVEQVAVRVFIYLREIAVESEYPFRACHVDIVAMERNAPQTSLTASLMKADALIGPIDDLRDAFAGKVNQVESAVRLPFVSGADYRAGKHHGKGVSVGPHRTSR